MLCVCCAQLDEHRRKRADTRGYIVRLEFNSVAKCANSSSTFLLTLADQVMLSTRLRARSVAKRSCVIHPQTCSRKSVLDRCVCSKHGQLEPATTLKSTTYRA